MIKLEQDITTLRRLFEPWNTAPNGIAIWEPEASDQHAQFKRNLIAKTMEIIAAGERALADVSFKTPQFGESDFTAIQDTLATDPELRDFIELAVACENVTRSLARDFAA